MSKKTFTLVIVIIIAIIGFFWWFLFFRGDTENNTQKPDSGTNLFPFGQNTPTNIKKPTAGDKPAGTTIDLNGTGSATARLPRLRQISFVPTAGAVAFNNATTTIIRYIERATGHVFETPSESAVVTQLSNVTIPKIHEALWSSDGKNLIIRYLNEDENIVRTFSAKIATSTDLGKNLKGSFLPDEIQNISVSGKRIFYITSGGDGAQGIRANIDGSAKTVIFNSTFNDWISAWATGPITLFSRPSSQASGAIYTLNPENGTYTKTMGGINGLEGLFNSDGNFLLYSGTRGNLPGTGVFNIKSNSSSDLGVSTLAGKCVWSTKQKVIVYCAVPQSPSTGEYPDDWYKGKISFSDSFWKINVATNETTDLFSTDLEAGVSMDAMKLSLDQNENVLIFTDKNDMTVWRYDLVY